MIQVEVLVQSIHVSNALLRHSLTICSENTCAPVHARARTHVCPELRQVPGLPQDGLGTQPGSLVYYVARDELLESERVCARLAAIR